MCGHNISLVWSWKKLSCEQEHKKEKKEQSGAEKDD
jgi:hypothetical protein